MITRKESNMKIIKKIFKTLLLILFTLIFLALLVWSVLNIVKYFMYPDYYHNAKIISEIPSLNEGFVPQGLDYDPETKTYIHSGYHGKNIELYFVTDSVPKTIIPLNPDGTRATGHGGGTTRAGDYLYICNNEGNSNGRPGQLHVFKFDELWNATNGTGVKSIGTLSVDTSSDFCFSDDKFIYVGEFYRAVDYETAESHYYTTPAGDENKAILSAYPLNADGSINGTYPAFSVSITSQVQGFAITEDGKVMLSRSWGLNPSYLEIHSGMKDSGKTINVSGKKVPLFYLDSTTRVQNITMPAFSEGLTIVNDKVAISFESAAKKYIVGEFFFAYNVVSYPIN